MKKLTLNNNDNKTLYIGLCPTCNKYRYMILIIRESKCIPPPIIHGICQCKIPVTSFDLIYQG